MSNQPDYHDYQPDYHPINTFFLYLDVLNITYLISSNGGMATKSVIENVMMKRHAVDRATVHDILNQIEYHNINCKLHPVPKPLLSKYPELFQVKIPYFNKQKEH